MENKKSKMTTILIIVVVILLTVFLWMLGNRKVQKISNPTQVGTVVKQ